MLSQSRASEPSMSVDQPGSSVAAVRGLMEIVRVVPVPGLLDMFTLLAKVVEHIQVC